MQIERTNKEIIIRLPLTKETNDLAEDLTNLESSTLAFSPAEKSEKIKRALKTIAEKIIQKKSRLAFYDFSFTKSREALENYKGSLSDAVVAERRSEL
jgi:hypothetical protein